MKSLVVYDSVFGNTEEIARAIAGVLASAGEVKAARVADVESRDLDGVDLLVVGSPTRAFRATPATMAFVKGLPPRSLAGVRVAAFDTRVDVAKVESKALTFMVKLFGYAAAPIAKQLEKRGGLRAAVPTGFFVSDKEGPMAEGERDRAEAWARTLTTG
ncbi:MAG: flavodoxin family protein [Spirochaetota bacterium]